MQDYSMFDLEDLDLDLNLDLDQGLNLGIPAEVLGMMRGMAQT